jgi:hypothetical protein
MKALSHQEVLGLARQGEAQAIAWLINQALSVRGVNVRAALQEGCLHVLLESEQVPELAIYGRVVYAAVLCLGAPTIETLRVYGRQQGTSAPAWTQAFRFGQGLPAHSAARPAADPSATNQASSQPEHHTTAPTLRPILEPPPTEPARLNPSRLRFLSSSLSAARPKVSLPLAVSVCAGLMGLGAGLSYLKTVEADQMEADQVEANTGNPASSSQVASPTAPPTGLDSLPVAPASVVAAPSVPDASPIPSPPVSPASEVAVTIKAVGDLIPGSTYSGKSNLPTEPGEQLTAEREFLFGNIQPFFDQADILFGNFESTLTDEPYPAKDTSQNMTFAFRTPPVYAQMLQELGFDVLSVANNHSLDFGEQGFTDTITHIEQAGMKAVGKKGQIVYTTANGVTVAFIGFSYLPDHNLMHDLEAASALVQEAKKQAKIVVISVHAGAEGSDQVHVSNRTEYFFGEDRGNLVNFARTMVDQGADLILGHGPHVPRAMELYQGKLIAYSLGNFMGYKTLSTVGTLGDSLILKAELDAEGNFIGGRIIPVALDANGVPKLDDYFRSVVLIRNLIRQDFPETPLTIDDMGYILRNSI